MPKEPSPNKTLKYLILTMVIISLVILAKEIILKPKPPLIPEVSLLKPPIEIDFELLKSPEFEELLPFEKISFPKEIGRENPFEPY